MSKKIQFVLGAADPEMEAIRAILNRLPVSYCQAIASNNQPVWAAVAYDAVPPLITGDRVVAVECGWAGSRQPDSICDHHRPGDPGYGRPPKDFFEASSIGQVFNLLVEAGLLDAEMVKTDEIRMVAAADHCLSAAYRGLCPGIDPSALMSWRVNSRARHQGRSPEAIMRDVKAALAVLRGAPRVCLDCNAECQTEDCVPVADLRNHPHVPELPEASARAGIPFIAHVMDKGNVKKEVLQGAPPAVIEGYMKQRPGSYGDPARGFAGWRRT